MGKSRIAKCTRHIREFLAEAGATDIEMEHGGKHYKVRFTFNGHRRTCTCSRTPSDHRAAQNDLMDARRVLRSLA